MILSDLGLICMSLLINTFYALGLVTTNRRKDINMWYPCRHVASGVQWEGAYATNLVNYLRSIKILCRFHSVYHWCDSCSRHVISFSAAKYTGHMVWLIDLSDIRYVLMEYECDIEISIDNDFFFVSKYAFIQQVKVSI